MDYPLMSVSDVQAYMYEITAHRVSEVARSPTGFLYNYLKRGSAMLNEVAPGGKITWRQKRANFIKRHLVQYNTHKTLRHRLALIAWAYRPAR